MAIAEPRHGCDPLTAPVGHSGAVVVDGGGNCSFFTKAKHAKDAGATAVVFVNGDTGELPVGGIPCNETSPEDCDSMSDTTIAMVERGPGLGLTRFIQEASGGITTAVDIFCGAPSHRSGFLVI